MKKITFIILLLSFYCSSQIKNGSIQYGKVTDKESDKEISKSKNNDADMVDFFNNLNINADKIEYTLNFNESEAYFFANPVLVDEKQDYNLLAIYKGGMLQFYQNEKTKEYREYIDSKRTGKQIVNNKQLYQWTLLNETKMIDGFTCYKATSPLIYSTNGKTNPNPKFTITAWYTPEIPLSYGPRGYGGLPGLILELQQGYSGTFYAKKINLNLEVDPKIDQLKSQKAISNETLSEILRGTLSKVQLEATQE
jgi:GLPGLI family protein